MPPSLAFPAAEIQRLELPEDDAGQPRMDVNFLGLTGPQGVLPIYYTQLIAERARLRDTAIRDFLDIFNHRMISLFYRAWEKYRFPIGYERTQLAGAQQLLPSPAAGEGPAVRARAGDLSCTAFATSRGWRPPTRRSASSPLSAAASWGRCFRAPPC